VIIESKNKNKVKFHKKTGNWTHTIVPYTVQLVIDWIGLNWNGSKFRHTVDAARLASPCCILLHSDSVHTRPTHRLWNKHIINILEAHTHFAVFCPQNDGQEHIQCHAAIASSA